MLTTLTMTEQVWLICGGRNFNDETMFNDAMSDLMLSWGCPKRIMHGGALGADKMAGDLAQRLAIDCKVWPAQWQTHGRAAGPIRNKAMIEQKPDLVVAFPGGRGTADMIRQARSNGVKVAEIKRNAGS